MPDVVTQPLLLSTAPFWSGLNGKRLIGMGSAMWETEWGTYDPGGGFFNGHAAL